MILNRNFTRKIVLVPLISSFWVTGIAGCTGVQVACPSLSSSENVYPSAIFADGMVKFESSGDMHNPLAAVLYRGKGQCSRQTFDKYDKVGAPPVVGSVFPYTVHGIKNLFVIMTWATDHSGLGIKGTSYQVYAYEDDGNGGFRPNPVILKANGLFGIEGMENFEDSHFFGKNPEEARQLIDRLGLK